MVHRIDGPGAGPGGIWVEAAPGVPKTVAVSKWFNMIQEELLAPLLSAGITPSDQANDQLSAALDVLLGGSGAAALKNRLVNGAVELWQRGTTRIASNVETYVADRFAGLADAPGAGAGGATVSRQTFTPGQIEVPGDPPVFLRWQQTGAATAGQPTLAQKVEGVATLAGGFATLSFFGKAATNANLQIRLIQKFGTAGSADVLVGSATVPITTVWTRQSATFAVPSILGKTVGAGNHLRYELQLPGATLFTIDLVNLQLEPGENATPYERRAIQIEYALAARYFETSYPAGVTPGSPHSGSIYANIQGGSAVPVGENRYPDLAYRFRVPKRARPTVVWFAVEGTIAPGTLSYYTGTGDGGLGDYLGNTPVSLTVDVDDRATGFPVWQSAPAAHVAAAHWTADAEL